MHRMDSLGQILLAYLLSVKRGITCKTHKLGVQKELILVI